jgi:hypothetical protein
MLESFKALFSKSYNIASEQMTILLPKLLAGILILCIGYVIARIIRGLAAQFFLAIRLDRFAQRLGISGFLARGDVRYTIAEILATSIYWFVLILSLDILAATLGLHSVAAFFGDILGYIPRIAVALSILIAGIVIGSFFGSAVHVAGSNAGFSGAAAAAAGVRYLIGFFAIVMALEHLQLATQLLVTTLQIVIAAVALALALAFGLGCKDLAAQTVKAWFKEAEALQANKGAVKHDEAKQ